MPPLCEAEEQVGRSGLVRQRAAEQPHASLALPRAGIGVKDFKIRLVWLDRKDATGGLDALGHQHRVVADIGTNVEHAIARLYETQDGMGLVRLENPLDRQAKAVRIVDEHGLSGEKPGNLHLVSRVVAH